MNLSRMSRRGNDRKLDTKRNDEWFIGVLNKLGIDPEQYEIDKKDLNVNAKGVICRKLAEYKTALDKANPDKAYRIKQLIENFDLLYEYKYEAIKRQLEFVNKPGEGRMQQDAMALNKEAKKIEENKDANEIEKEPIEGSTKWFYNKLMSSPIDFKRLRDHNSVDLHAAKRLIAFFHHSKAFMIEGDYKISKMYQDYIENFDFAKYCEERKTNFLEIIGTGKIFPENDDFFINMLQQFEDRIKELTGNKGQEQEK